MSSGARAGQSVNICSQRGRGSNIRAFALIVAIIIAIIVLITVEFGGGQASALCVRTYSAASA